MRTLKPPTTNFILSESCDICGATYNSEVPEENDSGLLHLSWNGTQAHDLFLDVCGLCFAGVVRTLQNTLKLGFGVELRSQRYTDGV